MIKAAEPPVFILRHRVAETAEPKAGSATVLLRVAAIEEIEGQGSEAKLRQSEFLGQIRAVDGFSQRHAAKRRAGDIHACMDGAVIALQRIERRGTERLITFLAQARKTAIEVALRQLLEIAHHPGQIAIRGRLTLV